MSQDSGSENCEEEEPSASEGEETGTLLQPGEEDPNLLLEPVEKVTYLLLEPEIEQQEEDAGEQALVGVQGPTPGQKAEGADLENY